MLKSEQEVTKFVSLVKNDSKLQVYHYTLKCILWRQVKYQDYLENEKNTTHLLSVVQTKVSSIFDVL